MLVAGAGFEPATFGL